MAERNAILRVPLQDGSGGTIGFAATRSSVATLHNGERVPGIDPDTRDGGSAAGFSLSIPTRDNVVAPLNPNIGRPQW